MPATTNAVADLPALGFRRPVVLDLLRPITLGPVLIVALLFGFLGAGRIVTGTDFLHLVLAGGLLVVANGFSNICNGLGDWVEDSVHPTKQDRPTVSGAVDPVLLMSVVVIGWGAAVFVSVLFLPAAFTLLYLTVIFFAWTYSYPPRWKARFPFNMLALSAPRGALGIAAAWVVFGSFWDPHLWLVLAVTAPYVFAANESRNISDLEEDRFASVENVATIWGEQASRDVTAMGFVIPAVVVMTAYQSYLVPDPWLILTVPLAAVGVYGALKWDGPRTWKLFYLGLGLIALLFFLPLVVSAGFSAPRAARASAAASSAFS